jgi:hypothetical protein
MEGGRVNGWISPGCSSDALAAGQPSHPCADRASIKMENSTSVPVISSGICDALNENGRAGVDKA